MCLESTDMLLAVHWEKNAVSFINQKRLLVEYYDMCC